MVFTLFLLLCAARRRRLITNGRAGAPPPDESYVPQRRSPPRSGPLRVARVDAHPQQRKKCAMCSAEENSDYKCYKTYTRNGPTPSRGTSARASENRGPGNGQEWTEKIGWQANGEEKSEESQYMDRRMRCISPFPPYIRPNRLNYFSM